MNKLFTLLVGLCLPIFSFAQTTTWDFSNLTSTMDELAKDPDNWTAITKMDESLGYETVRGYRSNFLLTKPTALPLDESEVTITKGLQFNAITSGRYVEFSIAASPESHYLTMTNGVRLIVPNVGVDDEITIDCITSKAGSARGISFDNSGAGLEGVEGSFGTTSTSRVLNVCRVTNVDKATIAIFRIVGNMNIYSVTLTKASGTTGINGIVNKKKYNDKLYNLAGQQVNQRYKGIIVKNGKKYFNK